MKLGRFWMVAVALFAAAPLGSADTAAPRKRPPPGGDPQIAFEKYQLPNGLEVILIPDKAIPIVAVSVWYHVGSGYETYGRSGFAHLFEHVTFQGSRHVGEDGHKATLRRIGATNNNGSTNTDRTNYYEVVPSNQLETVLWLESDRMGYMLEKLTEDSLANSRDVVRNERRQRYETVAYGKALFVSHLAMFPEGHPYRYLTIGKHEDLQAASLDDTKAFFKTWYVPANATLAIAGDFEIPRAKQLVTKWFATFPSSQKPTAVPVPPPPAVPTEVVITDDPLAKQTRISFVWHTPAAYAPGDAELRIIADALSREGPGRLYKALVYDRPLAISVTASQLGRMFSGMFTITVALRSEAKLDEVKQVVQAELARVLNGPLTAKEIKRVITSNEASAIRQLEEPLERAELLQAYNHYLGNPEKLTWDLDRFRAATAQNIRGYANKYLVPEQAVTIITLPQSQQANRGKR